MPITSCVISTFTTASFVATSLAAGWLTVSTASLQSVGAFLRPRSYLVSDPARNLFVRYKLLNDYLIIKFLSYIQTSGNLNSNIFCIGTLS